ncbi:MAG TPA: hypothetical protein PKE47_09545 [Verrucomicrobiota bacterium]|nr:hypothetical protein [Verrucomicrobiota bacterium]
MKRFWSILLPLAAAGLLAACSGVSLTGPNVTLLAPAVRGQVVDDATGEPLHGARVGREPLPPPTSARTETGAQRLASRDPATRTRRDGTFNLPAVRSAHLLLSDDRLPDRRLVIEQRGFMMFETNLPKLKAGPDGRVPEMDVGVVRLAPIQ